MNSVVAIDLSLRLWLEEEGSRLYNRVYLESTPIWNGFQVKRGVLGRIGNLSVSVPIVTDLRVADQGLSPIGSAIYSKSTTE
jgi:hypothetical protein